MADRDIPTFCCIACTGAIRKTTRYLSCVICDSATHESCVALPISIIDQNMLPTSQFVFVCKLCKPSYATVSRKNKVGSSNKSQQHQQITSTPSPNNSSIIN